MTATDEYTCSGKACTDCLFLLANGVTPDDWSEERIAEWNAGIDQHTAGYRVTLGKLREEHECARNVTVTDTAGQAYEYRADNEEDARYQHEFGPDTEIVSVVFHDLQTQGDLGGDCDCETDTFSTSQCDVCGTYDAGERHAVSFWKILDA